MSEQLPQSPETKPENLELSPERVEAQQNIEAGATFLRQLLDKYKGDIKLALAAYNAGPATVDKTGGIPEIKETQDYVEQIMKKIQ